MFTVNMELKSIASPVIIENGFASNAANNMASIAEMKLYKNASAMNCPINWLFADPATFLMPTSFALLDARAVDRFMKLTHASMMMKMAMLPKIYTYLMLLKWL